MLNKYKLMEKWADTCQIILNIIVWVALAGLGVLTWYMFYILITS